MRLPWQRYHYIRVFFAASADCKRRIDRGAFNRLIAQGPYISGRRRWMGAHFPLWRSWRIFQSHHWQSGYVEANSEGLEQAHFVLVKAAFQKLTQSSESWLGHPASGQWLHDSQESGACTPTVFLPVCMRQITYFKLLSGVPYRRILEKIVATGTQIWYRLYAFHFRFALASSFGPLDQLSAPFREPKPF